MSAADDFRSLLFQRFRPAADPLEVLRFSVRMLLAPHLRGPQTLSTVLFLTPADKTALTS